MMMRQDARTIVLGLAVSFAFVGCGGDGGSNDAQMLTDAASRPDTTKDTRVAVDLPIADVVRDAAVDAGAADLPTDLPIDGSPADGSIDTNPPTAGMCTCDTTIHATQLMQRFVYVPLDCFCASPFGFLCRDFDKASALCSRADARAVSAANFDGCATHYLHVTIGSVAKGRPTYATLRFDGNSFAGAYYEADLICSNLPADVVNDSSLGVFTTGYEQVDAADCGSGREWNLCEIDGGARFDATSQ